MLAPATIEEFAVAIDALFKAARTFGWSKTLDVAAATGFYHDAVNELPLDILQATIASLIKEWKWGRMPQPADLRKAIPYEFKERESARQAIDRSLNSSARKSSDRANEIQEEREGRKTK